MRKFVKLVVSVCIIHLAVFSSSITGQTRIIGGRQVSIDEFPYQLSLMYNNQPICGAALISPDTAISAAHCIFKPGLYSVRAGSDFINRAGVVETIRQVILHPSYTPKFVDYDLSILKLRKPLRLSKSIQPVNLPPPNSVLPPGTVGTISGWGSISTLFDNPVTTLRAVDVPIMPRNWCRFSYLTIPLTPRMFCAGFRQGGKDACQGDSGGPFVVNNTLYGVVSWGFNCAQPGFPGVYTNVLALLDYVKLNI